jgi:hypothetical protein
LSFASPQRASAAPDVTARRLARAAASAAAHNRLVVAIGPDADQDHRASSRREHARRSRRDRFASGCRRDPCAAGELTQREQVALAKEVLTARRLLGKDPAFSRLSRSSGVRSTSTIVGVVNTRSGSVSRTLMLVMLPTMSRGSEVPTWTVG